MLGLPIQTEVKRQLPKNAIYTKFQMNNTQKEKMDSDIAKLVIVNEILPSTVNIEVGKEIKGFFVVHVTLKKMDYNESTIIQLSKLIPQNILFVLEFENNVQLATYHTKLMHTEWLPKEEPTVKLKGFDFDTVWENIIIQIGEIEIEQGNTLDTQIAIDDKRAKLEKEIARLEKQARNEKQPKKKFELAGKVNALKKDLELIVADSGLNKDIQKEVLTPPEPIPETPEIEPVITTFESDKSGTVKAISIRPEYAAEIFDGLKTIEWRSWQTDYRGDLLICASSRKFEGCISGHALCMVTLKDIVPFTRKHLNGALMDFVPNPPGYAWILENVRQIIPFPYKGKLHLYDVDASLVKVLSGINEKEATEEFNKYYKPLLIEAGAEF